MPASVLAERVGRLGSQSWFGTRVAQRRVKYAGKDPADRLSHRLGDSAQCDLWFPSVTVPLGHGQVGSRPVVVVASFSRFIAGWMLPSRQISDSLAGCGRCWVAGVGLCRGGWCATTRRVSVGRRAPGSRDGRVHPSRGHQDHAVAVLDPESNGERAKLKTSLLPGRVFISPADFNEQLAAMSALPPAAACGRVHRWGVVAARLLLPAALGNDYSVDPAVIGRMVDLHADQLTSAPAAIVHWLRPIGGVWARHQIITGPIHVAAAHRTLAPRRSATPGARRIRP
jgi:hypothetical protein